MPQSFPHSLILLSCLTTATFLATSASACAQSSNIVSDDTLGAERSGVISLDLVGLPVDVIDGGAIRGSNLFHSFQEFNVAGLRGAYFRNPSSAIQTILARVTGTNPSEILGTLGIFNGAGVTSSPNLFFINPNGVIFGPEAVLDLPASFVATTANSIQLGDRGLFSASIPESSNLLTVNPSALLFNQISGSASIVNRSTEGIPAAEVFINTPRSRPIAILPNGQVIPFRRGLQVVNGKTLALVGGEVALEGFLTSVGGRIELGSVIGPGQVNLALSDKGFVLEYQNAGGLGTIQLDSAGIITSGVTGGEIQIQTGQLLTTETNGFSAISADTQGTRSGDIFVRATDSINLDNTAITAVVASVAGGNGGNITILTPKFRLNGEDSSVLTRNFSQTPGTKAGDISIEAGQFVLTNGAAILTSTLGRGNSGNLTIKASEFVQASGVARFEDETVPGGFQADIRGTGTGGTVLIETPRLILQEGAIVSARTDDGLGGNVIINAADSVELVSSGDIRTQTFGTGNAGNIRVQTQRLLITESSEITATAQLGSTGNAGDVEIIATESVESIGAGGIITAVIGSGDGGDIKITTKWLTLQDGGSVSAEAFTLGRGGNIAIFASDQIEVNGGDGFLSSQITTRTLSVTDQPSGSIYLRTRQLWVQAGGQITVATLGSNPAGNLVIDASESITVTGVTAVPNFSGTFEPSQLSATTREGPGGTIQLATLQLSILDQAEVSVSSEGTGRAGSLEVQANIIQLDNQGKIIATSASGNGGNIELNVRDLLLLRRGSSISTTAGTARAVGDGGNITIDVPGRFIIGVTSENSDISANAFTGSGGRVDITAQGIYGLQFRPRSTPFSDITASSEFGVSGVVTLNTPDVDPSRGLVALPGNLVDPSNQIDQSCAPGGGAQQSSFTVTGRGGLPENPLESLRGGGTAYWAEAEAAVERKAREQPSYLRESHTANSSLSDPIVEADSWIVDSDRSVRLVATRSVGAHQNLRQNLPRCSPEG